MANPIKIKITGSGAENDAPSAEDFILQLGDLLDVLEGVEQAVAGETTGAIEWRVTNAKRASPLEIEVTPFARDFAVNVDNRAVLVSAATAKGFEAIRAGAVRPAYFPEHVLTKVDRLAGRVLNGLATTAVDFGPDLPAFEFSHSTARAISDHVRTVLHPAETPYEEIGSIEGFYAGVEKDGHGRAVLYLKHRLTGDRIKCLVREGALENVSEHRVGMVFAGRRLRVSGRLHYRALGQLREVVADTVEMLRPRNELPTLADIQDPNFTGGLLSEEYLERLRDGRLS